MIEKDGLILDDDPDHEEHKQCQKKTENKEGLSDALKKSPHQPTRTVQAGSDPVQVIDIGGEWTNYQC